MLRSADGFLSLALVLSTDRWQPEESSPPLQPAPANAPDSADRAPRSTIDWTAAVVVHNHRAPDPETPATTALWRPNPWVPPVATGAVSSMRRERAPVPTAGRNAAPRCSPRRT